MATLRATTPTVTVPDSGAFWAKWPGRRIVLVSILGAALIALGFFTPRFWLWPAVGMPLEELVQIQPELNRAFHALQQLEHPWQRIDNVTNRVIEWRLLFPIVAHAFALPPTWYLALPHLGCLLALWSVASVVWRMTRDAIPTATATLLAATSSWFFVSTGWLAYFDSWLMLALVLASFAQRHWVMLVAALAAPWVDERFILALPLCVAVRALMRRPDERRTVVSDTLLLLAAIAPYLAIRIGAEITGARSTSQSYWSDRGLLPAPVFPMLWGVWNGLRLGWIAVLVFIGAFAGRARWIAGAVVGATLLVNVCVADDLSRSVSVALPVLIAGVAHAWQTRREQARKILPWLCAGNLLLPAQHVIASANNPVEAYHCVPVLYAYAEFEHARNPPDFANPATYNRRAMDQFELGNQTRALAAADLALRFDPKFDRARATRGIILYLIGRRDKGLTELDRALERTPYLYDARIQRAAFRRQAGDLEGALDDVQNALQSMPADWPKRKDAEQFARALAAQLARK